MHERDQMITGIVRQILAAPRSEGVEIMIGSFKFICNTLDGSVSNHRSQDRGVNIGLSVPDSYAYAIQTALAVSAKIDLINKLYTIKDEQLKVTIARYVIDPANLPSNMSEQFVNNALAKIFLAVKMPLMAQVGLFRPNHSPAHKAVREGLQSVGIDNIRTFADVDDVWLTISKKLPAPAAAPSPAPKS